MPEDTKFYHWWPRRNYQPRPSFPPWSLAWFSFNRFTQVRKSNINGTVTISGTRGGDIFNQNSSENSPKEQRENLRTQTVFWALSFRVISNEADRKKHKPQVESSATIYVSVIRGHRPNTKKKRENHGLSQLYHINAKNHKVYISCFFCVYAVWLWLAEPVVFCGFLRVSSHHSTSKYCR